MSVAPQTAPTIQAAQYLRMSTDQQRYSLENQQAAIAEYAARHGYEVVRTYADPGKSGLTLKGRAALQALLADVMAADRPFKAILVLDVSRWGRFQNPDEAAHYEFICLQAGVRVVYCGEMFHDAGSFEAKILKHLKRVMAGEWSRELSAKLSRAHRQQAALGFKQGGATPYAFRRLLIDCEGRPRTLLEPGQRKAISTDRVILVPGPQEEQETVRRIFRWYGRHALTLDDIAQRLAAEGPRTDTGRPWTQSAVRKIIGNEAYIGDYTYCKTVGFLMGPRKPAPRDHWIRSSTLTPIVSDRVFRAAQKQRARRDGKRLSDERMLRDLRHVLEQEGYLSARLIWRSRQCPCPTTYVNHFGSLNQAYLLIGYTAPVYRDISPLGCPWNDEELLDGLRRLHSKQGYATSDLIDADPELPSFYMFARRFGSVRRAYALAGLGYPTFSEIQFAAQARRREREKFAPRKMYPRADGCGVTTRIPTDVILNALRDLLEQHGYLSSVLINGTPGVPSAPLIIRRFGSLRAAYALAGWARTSGEIISEAHKRRWRRLNAARMEFSHISDAR